MNPDDRIVFIVDDDRRICEALFELLSTYDLDVVTFGSAAEYNRVSEARRAGLPGSGCDRRVFPARVQWQSFGIKHRRTLIHCGAK